MKSLCKKIITFITTAAICISTLIAAPITANAMGGEMALAVDVTSAKTATATISNISVPLAMDYKYDGYDGGKCPFWYQIIFGNYGVALNITAKKLMDYAEKSGEFSVPITKLEARAVSFTQDGDSFSTSSLEDCDVKLSATSSSITFDFTFADSYDVDMTKVSQYDVYVSNLGDYQTKSFSAKNGIVTAEAATKKGGKISDMAISGITEKAYTGKTLSQAVVIKDGSYTLVKGTDYTVSYKNNKNIGKATLTIKGKGDYTGSVTKTFKINPKKAALSSAKATNGSVKLTWTAQTGVTGYQIYYSTKKTEHIKSLQQLRVQPKKPIPQKILNTELIISR